NSLNEQTNKNFEWIIIDDGSIDDTKEKVENWIKEASFPIKYFYQENSGKHMALNKAVLEAAGKVFTCLDSDDWFYSNTTNLIEEYWYSLSKQSNIAGLIGLDTYEDGSLVGDEFPKNIHKMNWIDMKYKYKIKGDKAYFFNLDILKKYDFPNFKGNKHMPPSYQLYLISKDYNMVVINKPLKFVEYMADGITKNIRKQYIRSPENYALYRLEIMNLIPNKKRKIINAIHYNTCLFMTNEKFRVMGFKNKLLVFITKPWGYILYQYFKRA